MNAGPGEPVYCDSSALVKLVLPERESGSLVDYLAHSPVRVASSELCEVELVRAVARSNWEKYEQALEILSRTILLPLTASIKSRAGLLQPGTVRSLDAIHIATALEIQADLRVLVSYDQRMVEAAESFGIRTASPGR